jgi:hypothetical protein
MAKHTWLTAPTIPTATRMLDAYLYALQRGTPQPLAEAFAGYHTERTRQDSRASTLHDRWESAAKAEHRYARGKNAGNYRLAWDRCAGLMATLLVATLAPGAGFVPDTPPGILADALDDDGRYGHHPAALRALAAVATGPGVPAARPARG